MFWRIAAFAIVAVVDDTLWAMTLVVRHLSYGFEPRLEMASRQIY
jgi:hypothetical protein